MASNKPKIEAANMAAKRTTKGQKREDDQQADIALGERIRHLRTDILGIDRQVDFAERLGVTRGAVGNWEVGKGCKRANLDRIAETFQISLIWLTTGTGTPIAKQSVDARLELLPPDEYDQLYEHFQAMIDNRIRWLERKKADARIKPKKP